jgi:hypothetical protein
MSKLSRRYGACDDAALAGFKRILKNNQDWKNYEYGFLVIGWSRNFLKQLGHEAFMAAEEVYHYTEPRTDRSKSSITHTIPLHYAKLVRAFCHTHPTPGSFSTTDFRNFKMLRELKAKGKLTYDVAYYLMESSGQVRRSNNEQKFFEGVIIDGLDKAIP